MSTEDQADRLKAGTLMSDPRAETRSIAPPVPRILTVREILEASVVNAMSSDPTGSCTTGNYQLDAITGGLRPGFSWLVGADTSWGKSSFVVMIADENLHRNRRVLIVSSEDTEEVYGDRLMVRRSRVNALRYRDRKLTRDEMTRVTEQAAKAEPIPVYIDARRWAIEDLAPHVRNVIREERIDVVVFDYIQEFRAKAKHQDERVKFREIASVCRHIGKDAKVASILCSQLTIEDENKMPTRRNIRECRDIANASEVILIGYEPAHDILDGDKKVVAEAGSKVVYVDKVKNGPRKGKIVMPWDDHSACFDAAWDPELSKYDDLAPAEDGHWSDR